MSKPPHYCLTCQRGLARRFRTSTDETVGWEHMYRPGDTGPVDHEPVPVPLAELVKPDQVCDFCCGAPPVWVFTTKNRIELGPRVASQHWGACSVCTPLVEDRDLLRLAARYACRYPLALRPALFQTFVAFHEVVLDDLYPGKIEARPSVGLLDPAERQIDAP